MMYIKADVFPAYSMERQQGAGNGWAMDLDDRDIAQLLPLKSDQFQSGVS